jgi:hypothetical protein
MILAKQHGSDNIWLLSATNRRHVREGAFQPLRALGIPFNPDAPISSALLQSFPELAPIDV